MPSRWMPDDDGQLRKQTTQLSSNNDNTDGNNLKHKILYKHSIDQHPLMTIGIKRSIDGGELASPKRMRNDHDEAEQQPSLMVAQTEHQHPPHILINKKQVVIPTDDDHMDTSSAIEVQSDKPSRCCSPNVCEQYATLGGYSPRQMHQSSSFCRPTLFGIDYCNHLIPYRSDYY